MRFSSLPDSRALTALTLVACSSSLEVPPQSSIECSANRDCTEGLVCVTEAARCVLPTAQCIFFENDSAIAEPDGVACTLDDGSGGVCARGLCSPSTCGDGIVAASEECDDGAENGSASDRCRSNCRLPRCGDGPARSATTETQTPRTAASDRRESAPACLTFAAMVW